MYRHPLEAHRTCHIPSHKMLSPVSAGLHIPRSSNTSTYSAQSDLMCHDVSAWLSQLHILSQPVKYANYAPYPQWLRKLDSVTGIKEQLCENPYGSKNV